MQKANLFAGSEPPAEGERFEALLTRRNLVVERIVSSDGPKSDCWTQTQDEWVVLLRGTAVLRMDEERVEMTPGDHVFIAAGVPHAVESTSEGALWLAVHLHPESSGR